MFAIIYYYWSTCSCWPTDDREMSLSSWGPAALGGSGWNAASSSTLGRPQSTLLYTPSSLKGEKGHSRERGSRNRMNSVGGPSGVIHMSPGATKHSEFQLHCSPWFPPPHTFTDKWMCISEEGEHVCVEQRSRPPAAFLPTIQKHVKITNIYCKCYSVVILYCFLTNTVLFFWFSLMHLSLDSCSFFIFPSR